MAKLLLVDDDPVLLTLISKLLEKAGHTVTRVENAAECLAQAAAENFDLIITDVMIDRKSTRLNSSHIQKSRMPSSA